MSMLLIGFIEKVIHKNLRFLWGVGFERLIERPQAEPSILLLVKSPLYILVTKIPNHKIELKDDNR